VGRSSKSGTFGNIVLEALASGVPALLTDQRDPQFIVQPGETGSMFAKDNAHLRTVRPEAAIVYFGVEAMRLDARKQASWVSLLPSNQTRAKIGIKMSASAEHFTGETDDESLCISASLQ
jgi:glycosyltransferase involved in cell wall biosynthesis